MNTYAKKQVVLCDIYGYLSRHTVIEILCNFASIEGGDDLEEHLSFKQDVIFQ